jgi:hypothetical protein
MEERDVGFASPAACLRNNFINCLKIPFAYSSDVFINSSKMIHQIRCENFFSRAFLILLLMFLCLSNVLYIQISRRKDCRGETRSENVSFLLSLSLPPSAHIITIVSAKDYENFFFSSTRGKKRKHDDDGWVSCGEGRRRSVIGEVEEAKAPKAL